MKNGYVFSELQNGGNLRGYRIDEQGLFTMVSITAVNGWPVNRYGEQYIFNGEQRDLIGWPDPAMLMINDRFGIGVHT